MGRSFGALKSKTVWKLYFFVWSVGFLGLQYLTRTPPYGWPTLVLPFALPVILVAIGAVGAQIEEHAPPRPDAPSLSLLGRSVGPIVRDPPRPSSLVAWSIVTTCSTWIFPADVRIPGIHQFVLVWWGACAGFSWLVLPALISSNARRSDKVST
jgi:hypothetical protein